MDSISITPFDRRCRTRAAVTSDGSTWFRRHEEKETDVAIGVKAIEILHQDRCDTLVIVSGDTDNAPAIRTARSLFPSKRVCVAFPHARFNAELQQEGASSPGTMS